VHGMNLTLVDEALVVDPAAIAEAIGEATAVQVLRRSRSESVGGMEMIVAMVRVLRWVAAHLKRIIVVMCGIDYVFIAKAE
jgi:hypothetical protein